MIRWSAVLGLLALSSPSLAWHVHVPSAHHLSRTDNHDAVQTQLQLEDRAAQFYRSSFSTGHGVDFVHFVDEPPSHNITDRKVVWVTGYPRSGSSTLLSMVSETAQGNPHGKCFALFEPCHDGDEVDHTLLPLGCGGLLRQLTECKFEHVRGLWGWGDPHSSGVGTSYTPSLATNMCSTSRRVTFKTVDYGHNLTYWLPLLNEQPELRIVAAVRDPRGIWASWKVLEPFATLVRNHNFYTLEEVCRSFAGNIKVQHPRLTQVLFEHMVKSPEKVTQDVYNFLGIVYGVAQHKWVQANFNNKDCPPPPEWQVGFDDCREDSAAIAENWRKVLGDDDLRRFNQNPHCQEVKKHYNLSD